MFTELSRIYRLFVTLHHHIQLLLMGHFVAVCKVSRSIERKKTGLLGHVA